MQTSPTSLEMPLTHPNECVVSTCKQTMSSSCHGSYEDDAHQRIMVKLFPSRSFSSFPSQEPSAYQASKYSMAIAVMILCSIKQASCQVDIPFEVSAAAGS